MILSKLLLGILAVGCGAYQLLPLSYSSGHEKLIKMTVTLYRDTVHGSTRTTNSLVNAIDNKVVPKYDQFWLHRLAPRKIPWAVFKVHFRTPFVIRGEYLDRSVSHHLSFEHLLNLNYRLAPAELSENHRKLGSGIGMVKSIYKFKASPGSVVSITVRVKYPKSGRFRLQWYVKRYLTLREFVVPQVVRIQEPAIQVTSLRDLKSTPPALKELVNPAGLALMSQSFFVENIEMYGELLQNKTYFKLVGYFQPRHSTVQLVLSSKAEVQAIVHVPRLLTSLASLNYPKYIKYLKEFTFKAGCTVVCKHLLLMNPNLFYKVEIEGAYNPGDFYGFSFMVYEFESNIRSSPMILYFLDERPPAPAPAPAQRGNSTGIFDRVSSVSRPSSGLFDWSIPSPNSEARNIFGIRPRPNSIFSNWLNVGPSSHGQDPRETQTKDFAKINTNPSGSQPEEVNGVESREPSSLSDLHES